jgi:hypothetical protein
MSKINILLRRKYKWNKVKLHFIKNFVVYQKHESINCRKSRSNFIHQEVKYYANVVL